MLLVFKSDAYADIIMFGDVAQQLLKMMGHSGTVPSAIQADDVPAALERLKRSLEVGKISGAAQSGGDTAVKGADNWYLKAMHTRTSSCLATWPSSCLR